MKLQNLSTADFTCVVWVNYFHGRHYQVFSKFFKKRDVSDTSKTDEDPKKIREASSASFADEGDVFNEVLIRWVVERFYLTFWRILKQR